MLNQHLDVGLVRHVLEAAPPSFWGPDRIVWYLTSAGSFSTASAYSLVRQVGNRSWFSALVWQLGIPLKISFFMLRLLQGRIPIKDRLRRFGLHSPSQCWCCQEPREEDLEHVFCSGEGARLVWRHFEIQDGELEGVHTVRHLVWSWWLKGGSNIFLKFLHGTLPAVV